MVWNLRGLTLLAALACTTPALAQAVPAVPTPPPVAAAPASDSKKLDPAYYALFETMYGGVDQETYLSNAIAATLRVIKMNSPQLAELARKQPDLDGKIAAVMRPVLKQHQVNLLPIQREETAGLFASRMSPAEARILTAFYASPLGKRALTAASRGLNVQSTISGAVRTGEVSATDIGKDMRSAGVATARELSGKATIAEQRQLLALMRTSAYAKLILVMRDLPALRARIENMPMDPELEAKGQADIAEVVLDAREAAEKKPQ